ncbi:hypothetical protein EIP91_002884 [Steccherinum ochraceum]|uniref:SP-RING-type domain-containing protein n=1 Tax=Steccherinum ochraceum TaxID=92696 RepID=A0A4R0S0K7_9APHY|nr:hypothetical protein EIP91_002884 [Steccherinum ochraceum]
MPVASSSRQRRRREPSSDIEEDMPATRARANDDLEDDDDIAQAPARSSKKGRKQQKQEDDDDMDVDAAGDDDDEEVVDIVSNFQDQPIDRSHLQTLGGLSGDWATLRTTFHDKYYPIVNDVGASVAEFVEGNNGEKAVQSIDEHMRQLLDLEDEFRRHEAVVKDMVQTLARDDQIPNVIDHYEENVKQRGAEYKMKTSRQKYAKKEEYRKFRQAIFEVQHPGEAMPPVSELVPKENGDDSDDDDDVEVGGVKQDYKCPLTLTILVKPLTSTVCNHSFSENAIMDYLGQKSSVECPASGCKKMLSRAVLHENKALAKAARDAARRERAREESDEGSDDDEVIE